MFQCYSNTVYYACTKLLQNRTKSKIFKYIIFQNVTFIVILISNNNQLVT